LLFFSLNDPDIYDAYCTTSSLALHLLFLHAPLGVRRHQAPQRMVLMGQVDCFVQREVVGSQIALDGVQPHDEDALVVSSSYLVGSR